MLQGVLIFCYLERMRNMNKKRIAAISGLVGMGICILCICLSGLLPVYRDLLWAIGAVGFLVALSVSVILGMRKDEKTGASEKEEKEEKE